MLVASSIYRYNFFLHSLTHYHGMFARQLHLKVNISFNIFHLNRIVADLMDDELPTGIHCRREA